MYAEYTILPGEFASNISVYIDNPFESFSMQARDLLHRYVVLEEQNQTEISRILVPYLRQETEANWDGYKKQTDKKSNASSVNRTRASSMATTNSTTRPMMLQLAGLFSLGTISFLRVCTTDLLSIPSLVSACVTRGSRSSSVDN
ncbi:hypothetical protein V6Z93_001795 [Aspergillus fumigatus]